MITGYSTARLRAWAEPAKPEPRGTGQAGKTDRKRKHPGVVIAFDTETSLDERQDLKIGAFLVCWIDSEYRFWPFLEGLFYADDLPHTDPDGFAVLREYVRKGLTTRFYGPERTFMATLPDDEPDELRGLRWYGARPPVMDTGQACELLRDRTLTRFVPDMLEPGGWAKRTYSGEWMLEVLEERGESVDDLPIDERYGLDYTGLGFHDTPGDRLWSRDYFAVTLYSSVVDPVEIELMRSELGMPRRPEPDLWFGSRTAFVNDILYEAAYPAHKWCTSEERKPATIIGANLPFDLARVASAVRSGSSSQDRHNRFRGGFQFTSLPDPDDDDSWTLEGVHHKARIGVVRRGARGTMIDFISRSGDPKCTSKTCKNSDRSRSFFTDILNLGWVLTNNGFSLDSASKIYARHPEWVKADQPDFGEGVTENLITYCRRDVLSTMATYCGMMREVDKHTPLFVETNSYSPASLAKAYYRSMGLAPVLDRGRKTPRSVLGQAMSTFYGARAECHVRRVPVPVAYTDSTSMYPTVDVNMKLWDFLTHERVDIRADTLQVQKLLNDIDLEALFDRDRWPEFRGIALVQPDDNVLPVRTKLGDAPSTIAIARVTSGKQIWYTIPDLIASKLLHPDRKIPRIITAYRFYPAGELLPGLKPVRLRGDTLIDPRKHDFFKRAMEQRQSIKLRIKKFDHAPDCLCDPDSDAGRDHVGCVCDLCRQSESLKVIANSGAYGMFSEFNRQLHNGDIRVHGIDRDPKTIQAEQFDEHGEYCYPPVAALITGAAPAHARDAGAMRDRPRRHLGDGRHRQHGNRRQPYRRTARDRCRHDPGSGVR